LFKTQTKKHIKQEKIKAKQQYEIINERMFKIEDKVLFYDETIRRRSKKFKSQWIDNDTYV